MDAADRSDDETVRRLREVVAARHPAGLDGLSADPEAIARQLRTIRDEFTRLQMHYRFGIEEVLTKVNILRQEFEQVHDYSPIEHVRTRLKSPDSLLEKAVRTGGELTISAIRERIFDIAGIRITCSFVSDVYWIADMLRKQPDLTVLRERDYISGPKDNGYRSLHLIIEVPVFLSTHTEHIPIELQIRTIAMDFWASVEHKLSYKYRKHLPEHLAAELDDAARIADQLDSRMARLRDEIRPMPHHGATGGSPRSSPGPGGEHPAGDERPSIMER